MRRHVFIFLRFLAVGVDFFPSLFSTPKSLCSVDPAQSAPVLVLSCRIQGSNVPRFSLCFRGGFSIMPIWCSMKYVCSSKKAFFICLSLP
jgi:hypothetical protein